MAINALKQEEFLARNRISPETWKSATIPWDKLIAIGADHESQAEHLRDSAELIARVIQRFDAVHSVRWRVKDVEHLLEKIVRKRSEKNPKYQDIDATNYFEIVTDLVGIRALHLFKDECFSIDHSLRSTWTPHEDPKAYLRAGDPADLTQGFTEGGFKVEIHPAGYRSVHYVFATQPLQRKVYAEVQVRTIFEEGWSEIDHRIRYPNFSDDELVGYFLTIFNRLAGNADEMGSFVRGLSAAQQSFRTKLTEANAEKEGALKAMERTLADLDKMKRQDVATNQKLAELQAEFDKFRKSPSLDSLFGSGIRNPLTSLTLTGNDNLLSGLSLPSPDHTKALQNLLSVSSSENALAHLLKSKK